ncbi:MAG: hypothetical protein ABI304_11585 [Rudaea sp.]
MIGAALLVAVLGIGAPATAAGVEPASAYAGTWKAEITYRQTPYSQAHVDVNTVINDCWHSAEFQACHQTVDGKSGALIVYLYRPDQKAYAIRTIAPDSGAVNSAILIVKGNVWMYPWDDVVKGKTMHFRVINTFTSPASIDFRSEYSADSVHWSTSATGHEQRLPATAN